MDDPGIQIGPQGLTWRQRARLAQLRAQTPDGRRVTPGATRPGSTGISAGHLRLVGESIAAAAPDRSAARAASRNAAATRRAAPRSNDRSNIVADASLRANDPRWVLALRTAHALDHTTIVPEQRDRLIRLGRSLGLNAFDVNLIIAIVQDQARRGTLPEYCASAGADQLAMIPLPRQATWSDWLRPPRLTNTLIAAASLLGLQALFVWWLIAGR